MNSWLLLSLLMAHVIGDFYLQSSCDWRFLSAKR